jgi:tRNA (cmo5U34)-methyltransferase
MTSAPLSQNKTPHLPVDYDAQISAILPYYSSFHRETLNLVKALPFCPGVWMDTGCGTGSLVKKALQEFPATKFLLVDPSEGMLAQAREKMSAYPPERLRFLKASPTQDLSLKIEEMPEIITAIQCHHYLSREARIKATKTCYKLLKEGGAYITFENIRPLTATGINIGKQYWGDFQARQGRKEEEIKKHLARFDTEYFPITIEEHLELLRNTGFKVVELFWYSYMQAAFYCIK